MPFFPMFTDIKNRQVLIIGGGHVALRKVEKIMPFEPVITVIAPAFCGELEALEKCRRTAEMYLEGGEKKVLSFDDDNSSVLKLIKRSFADDDIIKELAFCIAATDNEKLNAHISSLCRESHIPVNVVDAPELCSFYFPAIISEGNVTVAVSTGGKSPTAARELKKLAGEVLPENIGSIVDFLGEIRPYVIEKVGVRERNRLFEEVYRRCIDRKGPIEKAELDELINETIENSQL